MRLRVGLHYDFRRSTADPASALAALLDDAEQAEGLGIDVIWVGERPTAVGGGLPAALPVCAALAARTRRVRIGSAVLPLPLHDPLRLAEDAASLDALSAGRFELGLGLGLDASANRGFGVAEARGAERLEEAVVLLRCAWAGPLDHPGPHFPVSGVEVWPKPVQPGGPPLWIGGGAPEAQRRAARLGTGLILAAGADPACFLEAWRAAAHPSEALRLAVLVPDLPAAGADLLPSALRAALRVWQAAVGDAGQLDLVFTATAADASSVRIADAKPALLEMVQSP